MSVTYAKSTRLPQINPVAENLRTVRLTNVHLRYRQNHIKGSECRQFRTGSTRLQLNDLST